MKILKRILLVLMVLILANLAYATDFEINFTNTNYYLSSDSSASLRLKSLKYEPYPANPGEYITLWIKAENIGGSLTENATFELIPKYPFSLDSNENPIREYGKLSSEEPVIIKYKVRVDKDAVDGANEIELRYNTDGKDNIWIYKKFEIEIEDAQTDFDLVVQEISGNEVSIAIANTGKNVAYSVIVRVPEQEEFQTLGTNGQMVGNLEDGDYTLVGFEIEEKQSKSRDREKQLKIQIDYTDEIGERRSMIKEVPFGTSYEKSDFASKGLTEGMTKEEMITRKGGWVKQQTSIYQKYWFWAIIIVVLYVGWKGFEWVRKKKEEKEEKKHKK